MDKIGLAKELFKKDSINRISRYKDNNNLYLSEILDKELTNMLNIKEVEYTSYENIYNKVKNKYDEKILDCLSYIMSTTNASIEQLEDFIEYLKSDKIPYFFPNFLINNIHINMRSLYIYYRGFTLINSLFIDDLINFIGNKKVLEIMSGKGFLTRILKQRGIDIIGTDNYSWKDHWNETYTDIENIDSIEAIEKYKDRDILIMSWAYMDDTAYKCLMRMREVNPNMIMIFIGEDEGGCTADYSFYENAEYVMEEECDKLNTYYQNFFGIHDRIFLIK